MELLKLRESRDFSFHFNGFGTLPQRPAREAALTARGIKHFLLQGPRLLQRSRSHTRA